MRTMKTILTGILLVSLILLNACKNDQETLEVLVITGTHDYNVAAFDTMFASFEGMECSIKEMGEDPGSLFDNPETFPYDAIVMYNYRQNLSEKHQKNLLSLLDKGVGLTVVHHAIAGFPNWIEYEDIIGATYVLEEQTRDSVFFPRPTWKHGVDMDIKVEDSEHPITDGISDFRIHDETYKSWVYHDNNHLLLSTDHELSNHQIAWTHETDHSKAFYIQLGHDEHAFTNEQFQKILSRGIKWTAGQE